MSDTLDPHLRANVIIAAGVKVANEEGLTRATHAAVSKACEVPTSESTVRWYFRSRYALWKAICKHPDASEHVRRTGYVMGLVE